MKGVSSFTDAFTPCRRRTAGERYEDRDGGTVLTRLVVFSCGCRIISREYHDGSVGRTVVKHDGAVLVDELLANPE